MKIYVNYFLIGFDLLRLDSVLYLSVCKFLLIHLCENFDDLNLEAKILREAE